MVVCKFYLQGTCKFGNTCRYEHDVSGGQSHGSSILRQQHSQPQQQLDQNPLVRSVVTDNLAADHGKQWMLSCYAPFKDKRPFPGFEDRSFEEIRYGFVEATTNGTLEQFKQEFNALYQDALNRTKMLQHPSPNVADLITQVYGAVSKNPTDGTAEQASRSVLASNSVFGQKSNAPSIFGGGQNSSSIFGGNKSVFGQAVPTGGSIFGQNPTGGSIFGQAPNTGQNSASVFGQNANVGQNSGSVFGQNANVGQNSGSVFGQNSNVGQNSGSIFGQNPNANTGQNTGSIFGQNPGANPTQNSIFGQNPSQNSVFGQKPDTNLAQNPVFGQNVNNQSIFGQNTAGNSGVFGQNPTNPPSIFGQGNPNPSSSIFGQTMPESGQQGVFGSVFTQNKPAENQNQTPFGSNIAVLQNTPFVQNPSAPQPSIFGGAQSHSSSIFGTPVVSQNVAVPQQAVSEMLEKLYSKLAELGVDEVKSFEGTMFEFGNIPEVPPPRELCF